MCIGLPMQVISVLPGLAICEGMGERTEVDMALVGDQPEGTWLLVFLGAAREVLSPTRAAQIADALKALDVALKGGDAAEIDLLFPDLVDREPELPEFLRNQAETAD